MRKITIILSLVVLFFGCSTTKNNTDMVISRQGITKYHIIVPKKPSENEMLAAQLMQESIYKISGAKVPIVNKCRKSHKEEIHIGNTDCNCVVCDKPNTISVERKKNSLYFNCKDDEYTLYSVEDFVENHLGVRKYASDCEYYPTDSNLTLTNFSSYTYTTPNSFRNIHGQLNRRDIALKHWLKAQTTEDMFANGYFVHTILKLCSPQKYFDTNPEYFALVNNERSREQVCWTNEKVFGIVKENLATAMLIQPDKQVWSVSQADNDVVCHCENCQRLIDEYHSDAAPVIYFVNKIAKAFPDKTISTLAYRFSRKCPEGMTIENNVQIMLCSIEADRNKTIEEQGKSEGSFAYDMTQWGKITKNIFLWDYVVDFDYYVSPFPNLHVLQPNIQFFVRNNAFQHFQQGNLDNGHEFSVLKNYLISKLLWNPNINADSIINDFCMNYYGNEAGSVIKSYIDDIEQKAYDLKGKVVLDIYGSPVKYKDDLFTKENLLHWENLFDIAEQKACNDSAYLARVQVARMPIDFAIMEIAKTDMYGQDGWFEQIDGNWQVKKNMQDKLENFYKACKFADVADLSEKGLTPDAYYNATKRMINSDVVSNLAFHKNVISDIAPSESYSNGKLSTLTDGVIGSDDYKMLWIGWWGYDFSISVDLEQVVKNKEISISSLSKPASWILHPISIECLVSKDNKKFISLGTIEGDGYNKNAPMIKEYKYKADDDFRYIKFVVTGTKTLPSWHYCYTKNSWVFLDEIIVK